MAIWLEFWDFRLAGLPHEGCGNMVGIWDFRLAGLPHKGCGNMVGIWDFRLAGLPHEGFAIWLEFGILG